jgi:hypothetical protein
MTALVRGSSSFLEHQPDPGIRVGRHSVGLARGYSVERVRLERLEIHYEVSCRPPGLEAAPHASTRRQRNSGQSSASLERNGAADAVPDKVRPLDPEDIEEGRGFRRPCVRSSAAGSP